MLKYKITDSEGNVRYEGMAEHLSNLVSIISGYDDVNLTFRPVGITDRGFSKTANYIWNPNTLAWETATGTIATGQSISSINYTVRIDVVGAVSYVGKAVIGSGEADAVWQIQKIDETVGLIIKWKNGNENFDNKWSEHLVEDYS